MNVYEIITSRIVDLLKAGTVPWHKSWSASDRAPQNFISRKPYRGVNAFMLAAAGYASPYWVTFKQAAGLGGTVRKGEKGFPVVFWNWLDPKEEGGKKIPFLRYYTVFNIAQCDGLTLPEEAPVKVHEPIKEAEAVVKGMPHAPKIRHGMDKAFYSPPADMVGMPDLGRFDGPEEYYNVIFHELTHSTGHASRLDRGLEKGAGFGTDPYAKEELVAEMGAAFLCGFCGISDRTVDNSAAYIQSWINRLKGDPKLVVCAAAQAQKACDYILGKSEPVKEETE